jgi:hypothetical protein
MALDFLLGNNSMVHTHDVYTIGNQTVVKFWCPGKKKLVRSPLSGSFNLSVTSTWTDLFNAAGGGSEIVNILSNAAQLIKGHTFRQPWFGRKLWGGTSPFKFSLPLQFSSRFNAYEEVYLPAIALLSFMYPRSAEEGKEDDEETFASYFVPGPPITFTKSNPDGILGKTGDRVEISMGSFLNFIGCYLTSISLTVENSFNKQGYPHNIKAQVGFDAMDVAFVNFDGGFMESGLGNQDFHLNKGLKDAIDFVHKTVTTPFNAVQEQFGESFAQMGKALGLS